MPPEKMVPVTSLRVKSVIASPADGGWAQIGAPLAIRGVAWSGDNGPVTAVDVSTDNGRSWRSATLQSGQQTQFGWRQWEFNWTPPREAFYTILARARDASGDTQPLTQEWNPSGYGWNVVPRINVRVSDQVEQSTAELPPTPARLNVLVTGSKNCALPVLLVSSGR